MREPVVGIDLGTSTSAVATVENGKPRVLSNRIGRSLTPSLVGFTTDGVRVVGEEARLLAVTRPSDVAAATKRFIGRRWNPKLVQEARSLVAYPLVEGPSGEIRARIAGRVLPLTQISAMVLGELKLDAEAHFGRPVQKCVITVPANFDDNQRAATKQAAQIAGLHVLRIVNEPTAAAVAYGLTSKFEGKALVFDLGGGTFDVSILEVESGVFQVQATGGDPVLGGEDFDAAVVQWLLSQLPLAQREGAAHDTISIQRLKIAAEQAKRELSEADEARVTASGLGDHGPGGTLVDLDVRLTRPEFERLVEPLVTRALEVTRKMMEEANASPKDIQIILLVGGMTRVPLIRKRVAELFGKPPVVGVNPDEVVALGAAVHASEIVAQDGETLLIDVASHSLGVGVFGGGVRKVVKKNTAIPVVAREVFLPSAGGQNKARIVIYQGESDQSEGNVKLGEVLLSDLRVKYRVDTPLEVTFELSSEGTVSVRCMDLTSGLSEALRITQRTELSADEVKALRAEQAAYHADRAEPETRELAEFETLLEQGDTLRRALEAGARRSDDEKERAATVKLVDDLRSLVHLGRTAALAKNRGQMMDVTVRLGTLVAEATSSRAEPPSRGGSSEGAGESSAA
jgi:molecular chaperone DnaK